MLPGTRRSRNPESVAMFKEHSLATEGEHFRRPSAKPSHIVEYRSRRFVGPLSWTEDGTKYI